MAHKTEFLYMSEPDTIAAGVLDARKCIDNAEEVFTLLAKGDYLMGGNNHNNHGMYIVFPKESEFPNMPVAGPDRRFVAMPAYLGGRFDICGQKWYGSNAANKKKGLPRSVLMVTLNNKDTGEPIAYMSANLLSAARTGAVPGVATRYLARKDAEVLLCIGCGAIGTSCPRSRRSSAITTPSLRQRSWRHMSARHTALKPSSSRISKRQFVRQTSSPSPHRAPHS